MTTMTSPETQTTRFQIPELKIKIKSILAEIRMIEKDAEKLYIKAGKTKDRRPDSHLRFRQGANSLYTHSGSLRGMMRPLYLAYAFLRGKPYSKLEGNVRHENRLLGTYMGSHIMKQVLDNVNRFGALALELKTSYWDPNNTWVDSKKLDLKVTQEDLEAWIRNDTIWEPARKPE